MDTSEANVSLSEFRASLAAVLTLMNTIGLPPPFDEAAAKIQRGIALAWAFKTALDALAMSSPYTAVIGAMGFITTATVGFGTLMDSLKGYQR